MTHDLPLETVPAVWHGTIRPKDGESTYIMLYGSEPSGRKLDWGDMIDFRIAVEPDGKVNEDRGGLEY